MRHQIEKEPVVKFLNELMIEAVQAGASDIHLSPTREGFVISFRVDGELTNERDFTEEPPYEELISRIKVLAKMNIAQRLLPQDGHFQMSIEDRQVDFRVAVIPSLDGEAAVLRLFDRAAQQLGLDNLGMAKSQQQELIGAVSEPSGMVLVAGPIGSGKTTTLYALLGRLAAAGKKIMTIEDPVESRIPGTIQVCVNERAGLTFAEGLKAIVRHDPDVIMIGEIRDRETAAIAIQAAVLGHIVLATVHAETALLAVERLMHLDVERYQLAVAFNCIVAQRLVPRASGRGRVGIFETLLPGQDFKRQVINSDGFLDGDVDGLWDDGMEKVSQQVITKEALGRELPAKKRNVVVPLPIQEEEQPTTWLDECHCRRVLRKMARERKGNLLQEVSL